MMKALAMAVLLALSGPAQGEGAQAAPARQSFEEQHALVKASSGEARWDEIPWTTSLWEGRKRAAAEGKPLFIWAANGNPVGVT